MGEKAHARPAETYITGIVIRIWNASTEKDEYIELDPFPVDEQMADKSKYLQHYFEVKSSKRETQDLFDSSRHDVSESMSLEFEAKGLIRGISRGLTPAQLRYMRELAAIHLELPGGE